VRVVGALVLVLALAQVVLPRLAASRIRARVGKYGTVESVRVKAWPAVELLWGSADSVTVRAKSLLISPAQTAKLLWEARGVNDMELTAPSAREGQLRLSDVSFSKHGRALSAQARMTEADVRAALPAGFGMQLVKSEGGEVEVRASGGLFGIGAAVDAVASAREGKLVVRPRGLLLEGLQLTLFSEPHMYVESVSARVITDPAGGSIYQMGMVASLR
jgi:hypothetical protein